jgi:osmotically-inducible protein OsmY
MISTQALPAFLARLLRRSAVIISLMLASLTLGCTTILDVTTSEPIYVNPGKRTLGARIDDSNIETIAEVNLKKASAQLAKANVTVNSYNAVVLLTGQVPTEELRQLAGATVNEINTVRQVHNELVVGPNVRFSERTYDTWLTTKVKTQLLAIGDIEGRRVRVVTEARTVFLMGLVSRREADRITDVVRTTRGVGKVVKVFEYID